jgi:hypothetical protein
MRSPWVERRVRLEVVKPVLQSAGSISRLVAVVVVVSDGCAALLHARDINTLYR